MLRVALETIELALFKLDNSSQIEKEELKEYYKQFSYLNLLIIIQI